VTCLLLCSLIRGFGGLGLLFDQRGNVLLAEAEGATSRKQLGIGGWLAASIAAPNVCFNSFHKKRTPEFALSDRKRPSQATFFLSYCLTVLYHVLPASGFSYSSKFRMIHIRQKSGAVKSWHRFDRL
jgi:hypothetical protein